MVKINVPHAFSAAEREKLERAAHACPVHKSLHPDVARDQLHAGKRAIERENRLNEDDAFVTERLPSRIFPT